MERISKLHREQLRDYFKEFPGPVKKEDWIKYRDAHPDFMGFQLLLTYRVRLVKTGILKGTEEEWDKIYQNRYRGNYRSPLNQARSLVTRMLRSKQRQKEQRISLQEGEI
jgi:hypothetical protein